MAHANTHHGFAVLVCAAMAAAGIAPASAQSGYDRPGGDYATSPVTNGDPAVCATRCEHDKNCRSWSFSYPPASGGPAAVPAQARSHAAGKIELLRFGRPRRRRHRAAAGRARIFDRSRRRRLPLLRNAARAPTANPAPRRVRPNRVAAPGPIGGRAMAPRRRAATSRTRSSRRTTGPAAYRAWCASAICVGRASARTPKMRRRNDLSEPSRVAFLGPIDARAGFARCKTTWPKPA